MDFHDVGFDIFDCHHHVGDVKAFMGGALPHEGPGADEAALAHEMAERVRIMDAGGVRQAAVIPGHGYGRPNGLADTRDVNTRIAAYRDRNPSRFPVAIGIAEPLYEAASLPEIDRCATELGLRGISFHTRFQGASMDSPWIARYVERMAQLAMVPVIHAIPESPDEAIWKTAALARSFPDVKMLILDSFESFESTKHNSLIAELCPNLLFDVSLSFNFDFIEVFASRFGAHRVVFGTDLYSPPLGRRISHLVPQIIESSLSREEKELIFGGNARALFGVTV